MNLRSGRAIAGRVKRAAVSSLRMREGYHYGEGLPAGTGHTPQAEPNVLETYFDTHTEGRGLWKWRHYFPIYDRHLKKFVGREVHIVEIGVFSGGSIDMWRAYFGESAHIYGVDIEPACKRYEGPRTRIFIGDQADPTFWRDFMREVPEVDIVLDDGGHLPQQQIPTLTALLPHMSPGGVYLCEDAQGQAHPFHGFIHGLSLNLHRAGEYEGESGWRSTEFQRAIDSVHLYPFVSVIEKRTALLDRLVAPKHGTEWEAVYQDETFPRARG